MTNAVFTGEIIIFNVFIKREKVIKYKILENY